MTQCNDSRCRFADCEATATTTVRIPAVTAGMIGHTFAYCDEHAGEILGDPMVFPGARIVALPGQRKP